MKTSFMTALLMVVCGAAVGQPAGGNKKIMDGFPPSRESQVSFENYRDYPYSKWSFHNMGAPMHTLMIPRGGAVHRFKESNNSFGKLLITINDSTKPQTVENVFATHETDGLIIIRNNEILFEKYWNGLTRDYQHIWFSMTKSLTSAALGILVNEGKIDLSASPVKYIPELKNTPWERTTIQQVIDMTTALGYKETYTDTAAFFYKNYAGTGARLFYVPGADTATVKSEVLGTYDFLTKVATADTKLQPGYKFDYNSSNVDVISWLISRISGQPYHEYIQKNIWSKLGAEHDAFITTDRTYTAVATAGMNTTLRDAAMFATMTLNRGNIDGKQIIPAKWVDQTLKITAEDKERMIRNGSYLKAGLAWQAYKNFWWIIDAAKGEYCARGIHGQVIYINRSANLVIVFFSSQPEASSIGSINFMPKLDACKAISKHFSK